MSRRFINQSSCDKADDKRRNPAEAKGRKRRCCHDSFGKAEAGKTGFLTLSGETADIDGGLLLRDTASEVNCTFETLLRLSREELAGQAAAILFD